MKTLLWVCVLLCWQTTVHAWGDDGHRITAQVANELLSDSARQEIRRLVGSDDLTLIANWMDDEREMLNKTLPGSSRWHYENREACANKISSRACPRGQCITKQLERSLQQLKDVKLTDKQRTDALRIAVHLLGDLHQPLHLSDNYDRGGNDTLVRLPREREPRRLHDAWDTRFLKMNLARRNTQSNAYAESLVQRFAAQSSNWQTGAIEQWANETQLLGGEAYRLLPAFSCRTMADAKQNETVTVPVSYINWARSTVDIQLMKAGVRLAAVLNQTFAARAP
jgi:S1/P1 Nuclease